MTTTAPITPLSQAERRVAEHLVRGVRRTQDIATQAHLSPHTVHSHIHTMRAKLHCPPRCPQHILVHTLLATGQVPPPAAPRPAPDLDPDELRLLRALTEHSRIPDIAQAARIAPGDAKERITDLVLAARAGDTTNLIVLAHAWNLLSADRSTVTPEGASR